MNLEKLVKFEERKDLEDWASLDRLLKSSGYFSDYRTKERPLVSEFGRFLRSFGVKRITDAHAHSFKYAHFRQPRPVEGTICPALPVTSIPNFPIELLLWVCREVYTNGAGLPFDAVAFPLPIYHMDARQQNAYLLSRSKQYTCVHPFALAPPSFSKAELEALVDSGFRGLKPYYFLKDLGISRQEDFGEAYGRMRLSDWLTDELLDVAEKKGVPVVLHVAPSNDDSYRDAEKAVRSRPNVNFLLAHFGLCSTVELFKRYLGRYAGRCNAFLDASNVRDPGVLAHAFRTFDAGQLVYGSDLPFGLIRHGTVVITKEMVDRLPDEGMRERLSKAVGMPFPSTKGDYVYLRQPSLRELQRIIPLDVVESHRLSLVEQLLATKLACEGLVEKKEFGKEEMSGLLQSFFHGNARRLLSK